MAEAHKARGVAHVDAPRPTATGLIRRPTSNRRRRWLPVASLVLGIVLLMFSSAAFIGGGLVLSHVSNTIQQQNLLGSTGSHDVSIDGPVNILLVGLDTRVTNPALGSRSDSIIIVHIPASHDRAYLISIPRDTNAIIPPFAKTHYPGGSAKINAAYQYGSGNGGGTAGGVQLLALTIEQIAGITFNAAVVVNFDGFKDVVAALGGVNMCIDERTVSIHSGFLDGTDTPAAPFKITDGGAHLTPIAGTHPMIYEPGCRHLTAAQALDYVRQRDLLANGDGDYGRQRHQQQFVKALLQEGLQRGLSNPLTLNTFLTKVSKAFVFDGHGISLANWIFEFKGISPNDMILVKTNAGTYNTVHIGGESREELSAKSLELLSDVNTDTVDQFVAANPNWVSSSPATGK
jgi:LCP family protein required for cell wall assembly